MRSWRRKLFATIALAALSAPLGLVPLHANVSPGHQDQAIHTVYDQLAEILVNDEDQDVQAERLLDGMVAGMAKDPNIGSLETAFPGALVEFRKALAVVIEKEAQRIIPLYRADLANFYRENLSDAEAEKVFEFWSKPAWKKFRLALINNGSTDSQVSDLLEKQEISTQSLKSDVATGVWPTLAKMDQGERKEVIAFFASPEGRKLSGLSNEKLAIDTKWSNYMTPEGEAEVQEAVIKALHDHVAKTDPELADLMVQEMSKEAAQ